MGVSARLPSRWCRSTSQTLGVPFERFVSVLLVVLEAPAIAVGVALTRVGRQRESSWSKLLHEVLLGKGIFLLVAGLLIGYLAGPQKMAPLAPFFFGLFKGALAVFLLEMGLAAGARLKDLRSAGPFLVVFGMLMPLFSGAIGAIAGRMAGMSPGGTVVLATLAASASYIAAPRRSTLNRTGSEPGLLPNGLARHHLSFQCNRWYTHLSYHGRVGTPVLARGGLEMREENPSKIDAETRSELEGRGTRKLVTIIAEASLETELAAALTAIGVSGYTALDCRGAGRHGSRPGDLGLQSRNVRIEVLCDDARADAIVERLQGQYFADWAIILYLSDVQVLRPHRF